MDWYIAALIAILSCKIGQCTFSYINVTLANLLYSDIKKEQENPKHEQCVLPQYYYGGNIKSGEQGNVTSYLF